ncbi:ABC transporter ATP-binding protein/permease [Tyzzerella sp. OttesenSCG-928-J15]|nr:ABC transporter ATP-binding protein/permease [Tyzzerella sp. OttesenSCG-928-J15]
MNQNEEQDYSKKLDFGLWLTLFKFMKNVKKETILLILMNVLYSLIASLVPQANKYAMDTFVAARDLSNFVPFAVLVFALIALSAYLTYKTIQYSAVLEVNIVYDIREAGFKNLQKLSFSYYDTTPVGWILARMSTDAQRIGDVIAWSCVDLAYAVFMVIFIIINMFLLNPGMALIGLCMVPVVAIISVYFQKRILASQREVRKINSKITGAFNEGISGARTTKTLVREKKNFDEFEGLSSGMRKASIFSAVLSSVYMPIVMMLGSITTALVIYVGSGRVVAEIITFGTLSAFINYVMQMFEPIQYIARIFAEMQSAQAAGERTVSLINTVPDIVESAEVLEKYGDALNPNKENWESIDGEIEFKDVSFSYKTGEKVLKNFNLKIEKGQNIALVGATGAGKSTIVNLICRFYEPVEGEILIDGVDYRKRSQSWLHSNLGYVLQTPHLFSGTVMENIRYGKLDATDDEVIEAAKTVNAYDFIMKMEKGFATDVGEGGNRLSSGEKQLISFARAILRKPAVFVLDEATSSIDTETEQLIQKAIENVLEGRTSFLIAHRLSTIKTCDKILVIEGGEIVEAGTHKELINKKGRYFNLYTNQFIEESGKAILA